MVVRARALAELQLGSMPVRLAHVRGVASSAVMLARHLGPVSRTTLMAAAWLQDVGCADTVRVSGFAALDGAGFARTSGFDEAVVSLVAYRGSAFYEARERGLLSELATFYRRPPQKLLDALTYCDLTTGRRGLPTTAADRLEEILHEHPPDDPVHRATLAARRELLASIDRVQAWL